MEGIFEASKVLQIGFRVLDNKLHKLRWADSSILIATSEHEMQHMIDMTTGRFNHMGFNWKPNVTKVSRRRKPY